MLPGSRTLTIYEEARMLAGDSYTTYARRQYLESVERCPRRGPEVARRLADLLHRLVRLRASHPSDAEHARNKTRNVSR